MFTGFPPETDQYFLDLRFHNNITFFHETRERYVRDVQQPFYAFITDMLPVLTEIDPQMEQRPYKSLARIRRDTRFTKDKTPYRDHLWVWFHRAGEPREDSLGFWFEFGLSSLSWGLGTWGDCKPMMELFRREIAGHHSQLRPAGAPPDDLRGQLEAHGGAAQRAGSPAQLVHSQAHRDRADPA